MPKTAIATGAKHPARHRPAKRRAGRSARPMAPIGAGWLASTSSFLSLARVAGALAGFATQVVLARTLQASALGVFYSVTSLAAVVGLIAAHGYPAIAPRFLSRYREQGKENLIAAFIARAERDALVYVAIATLGVLALALWPSLTTEARLGAGRRRSVDSRQCRVAPLWFARHRHQAHGARLFARYLHQAVRAARRASSYFSAWA